MWAMLAVVMTVVVAFVLWSLIMGAASTANVPQVQLVPQESFIYGNNANVTLVFGRGYQQVSVSLVAPDGPISTGCVPTGVSVAEGQKVAFRCALGRNPKGIVYIVVRTGTDTVRIKWAVG